MNTLNLSSNNLTDFSGFLFANLLKFTRTLTSLDLSNNMIGSSGISEIQTAIDMNINIKSVKT